MVGQIADCAWTLLVRVDSPAPWTNGRTPRGPSALSWNGSSASPDDGKDDESVVCFDLSCARCTTTCRCSIRLAAAEHTREHPQPVILPEIPIQPVMGFEEEEEEKE
jgi:hypothetical protein